MEHEPSLLECFQEDHAELGRGFHRLAERLRAADDPGARDQARELDERAGAHIAFEEEDFYPRLLPMVGLPEVERLKREHRLGLEAVEGLLADSGPLDAARRGELLERADAMSRHIAECGDLFHALGRMGVEEKAELRERLVAWRRRKPLWSRYAREHPADDRVSAKT